MTLTTAAQQLLAGGGTLPTTIRFAYSTQIDLSTCV